MLGRFIDAVNRIQASWISDVRQALGYDLDEEIFVISHIHISFGMAGKLRLASALSGEETALVGYLYSIAELYECYKKEGAESEAGKVKQLILDNIDRVPYEEVKEYVKEKLDMD